MNYSDYLNQRQQLVNQQLTAFLPNNTELPQRLHEAMRYTVLNGGKRIRPLLVYATGEMLGATTEQLHRPACAIELMHCYSLVHDDLPAMDNDDLRRGMPTCHKAFDEATAILTGDALQSLAFSLLADTDPLLLSPSIQIRMIATLANAAGSRGMAGGQDLDLLAAGQRLSLAELQTLHRLKTGALIRASVQLGGLAANSDETTLTALAEFANNIGLAFQIQDDIIDVESSTELLGKRQGADIAHHKATYPALMGMEAAKTQVKILYEAALTELQPFADAANPLRLLASYIIQRQF